MEMNVREIWTAVQGTTDLSTFPKSLLLANESTAQWHEFGREWMACRLQHNKCEEAEAA